MDWAIQLNYYRILLQKQGLEVTRIVIQAMCRDNSLRIAKERGVKKPIYLIPINFISDRWITRYMEHKADALSKAFQTGILPPPCKPKERWHDRKCLSYCQVATHCPYGIQLKKSYPLEKAS